MRHFLNLIGTQNTALHEAVRKNDIQEVRWLVQQQPGKIDEPEPNKGWTALHVACYEGFDTHVRELLLRGAGVNTLSKDGQTPLHVTAVGMTPRHIEIAKTLLKRRGADVNIRDKNGRTAYDIAVEAGNTNMAAFLRPLMGVAPLGPLAGGQAGGLPTAPPGAPQGGLLGMARAGSGRLNGAPPPPQQQATAPPAAPWQRGAGVGQGPTPQAPTPEQRANALQFLMPQAPHQPQQEAPRQQWYPPVDEVNEPSANTVAWLNQMPAAPRNAAQVPPTQPTPSPNMHLSYGSLDEPSAPPAPGGLEYDQYLYPPVVPALGQPRAEAAAGTVAARPRRDDDDDGGWGEGPSDWGGEAEGAPRPQTTSPPPTVAGPAAVPQLTPYQQAPQHQPEVPQYRPAAAAAGPLYPPPAWGAAGPAPPAAPHNQWNQGGAGPAPPAAAQNQPAVAAHPVTGTIDEDDDWTPRPPTDWGGTPDTDAPTATARLSPLEDLRDRFQQLRYHSAAAVSKFAQALGGTAAPPGAPSGAPTASSSGPAALPNGTLGPNSYANASENGTRSGQSLGHKYTLQDLQQATHGFAEHHKIGSGGFGPVFRGMLDGTPMAIKVLDRSAQAMQGQREFEREATILSRLHHPNIVGLLGTCPEAGALVYELMEGGNLEDALCRPTAPALPWTERIRIAAEVAAALIFLHSAEEPIIHMDLKPSNILLDRSRISKLGDVGLARLMPASQQAGMLAQQSMQDSRLVGTLSYMDPEYLRTGRLSPKSDVYSLGMVMLQLLTGRDASGLVPQVETAVAAAATNFPAFQAVVDRRAGPWPAMDSLAFAKLALSMVEYQRSLRPDLKTVILPQLRQMQERARMHAPEGAPPPDNGAPLPMFVCPITQDVMEDPVFAPDGYTYERVAIEAWLARHDTSPMTNMPLPNKNLTPNNPLRSSIREWLDKNRR